MSIWHSKPSVEQINQHNKDTMVDHCGIVITELTDDCLVGTMPADARNQQPFGILHGGANCVLAETLGSIAANLTCNPKTHHAVGLNITTSHIKAVRNGLVRGEAKPEHIGKRTQVWVIKTYNGSNQLTSTTNLTLAIVERL